MPGTIAVISNPSKRRRRSAGGKKRRSAAQRAATARMLAANRSKRRGANPRRRKTHRKSTGVRHYYHANPAPKKRARRSRRGSRGVNLSAGGIMGAIKPAFIGAGGAVAVQATGNMLSGMLPVGLYTGYGKYAIDAGLAIALGRYGRRFLGNAAVQMRNGALAITAYQVVRDIINGTTLGTSFGLSGLGYRSGGMVFPGVNRARVANGMAEYFPSSDFNGVNAAGGLSMGEYFPA